MICVASARRSRPKLLLVLLQELELEVVLVLLSADKPGGDEEVRIGVVDSARVRVLTTKTIGLQASGALSPPLIA